MSRSTVERLICDAAVVAVVRSGLGPLLRGEPLRVGRRTRKISAGLRRALRVRDGGCQFPGCHRRRHLEAHHVVHWKNGGGTDLDNLVLVCRFHHMQVHEGGFTVGFAGPTSRGATLSGWVFHRPDGVAVPGVRVMLPGPRGDDADVAGGYVVDEEAAQARLGGGFRLAESVGVFCRAADGPSEAVDFTGADAFNAFDVFDPPNADPMATAPAGEPTAAPSTASAEERVTAPRTAPATKADDEQPALHRPVSAGEDLLDNTDFSQFDTFDEIMAFCRKALFEPQATR
ncbi:hypothetical protein ABIB25_002039 [Nakamurella sp. UYEF19]|uniref:HNH endonuclease signature motif containing protein n=1 Tax=Nakamurella sp. UYEF19 TaxID=1756392 RepID=UPI003397E157